MEPSTPSVVCRVARKVSGRLKVAVLGAWPLRAWAACLCSGVAWISAKVLSLLGCEGRYLNLSGPVVGSRSHASVRQSAQVCAVADRYFRILDARMGVSYPTMGLRISISVERG